MQPVFLNTTHPQVLKLGSPNQRPKSRNAMGKLSIRIGDVRRLAQVGSRRLSTITDIASPADMKSGNAKPQSNVMLAEKKLSWKSFVPKGRKLRVEASGLFCASNDPLQHTADDVGRYFQASSPPPSSTHPTPH